MNSPKCSSFVARVSAMTVRGSRCLSRLVLATWLLAGVVTEGATVLSRAPNTTVHLDLPFTSLEFENPLSGSERVLGHPVLEWLDADYTVGIPPGYGDWIVNPTNSIDGNVNEVWLRATGHIAQAKFHVVADTVSIHLLGDNNDGVATVYVDGAEVARVAMNSFPSQTVLVIVRDLPVMMHHVLVRDESPGQPDDVAIMGAAALMSDFKWVQPPAPIQLENVFNGWNERSVTNHPPIAADDWLCTSPNPITKIRWWGSFANWVSNTPPPLVPNAYQITIWTDAPADPADPESFSHPSLAIWQTHCTNFKPPKCVGYDYDPRTEQYEACFLFEQDLAEREWFYQQPGPAGTNIYWISIAGEYWQGTAGPWPWGWKTRPRDPTSPAPDDAVRIIAPPPWLIKPGSEFIGGEPIYWPDRGHSWDLAFELISEFSSGSSKWEQWPDLSPLGMDVKDSQFPPPPVLLADDFLCTSPGPITNITLWGSWRRDLAPAQGSNVIFTLSLHSDIPANQSPAQYSMPGPMVKLWTFQPGSYRVVVEAAGLEEGWYEPPETFLPQGDTICYRYEFDIPSDQQFMQQGTLTKPVVYWLDCQAQVLPTPGAEEAQFGWKTCVTNWNDTAVWVYGSEPFDTPLWNRLLWMNQRPLDLAFRINSGGQAIHELKWSQPPSPYFGTNNFNGWNEPSLFSGEQMVADDWVCADTRPISDIHWWGSFLGWQIPSPPETAFSLPEAFTFTIWTDVPANPAGAAPFSHPGQALWQHTTTNYSLSFVGWDWDPRNAALGPEACFKFHVDLRPEAWFYQEPGRSTNIYWVSIAAVYPAGTVTHYPWGWKTRPRDLTSPAPDDAVRIFAPTAPVVGSLFQQGSPIEFPTGASWDMAFELTAGPEPSSTDWGDAPKPYPTLAANNGAVHAIAPGVFLGARVDNEADGQPDVNALGDDNNPPVGVDDEDGVVLFGSHMIPGGLTGVAVTASTNGYLSAWVDFNLDGSWATPGDQVFTNVWVTNGLNTLYFTAPFAIPRATNTFARFRFSTTAITNFTGWAADGEVEDHRWWIEPVDFGDAPEPTYPTTYANNGAYHWLMQGVFMGPLIDAELDGQPNANATGDDLANLADEDGVSLQTPLISGHPAAVQVLTSLKNGILNAWIDFGGDGSWATPGDQIASNLVLPVAGANLVNFVVPASAVPGSSVFARFRFSTAANLSFVNVPGNVPNGEVEDYQWRVEQLDFGDAPDPSYPTLLANNGARHVVGPMFLGKLVDAELDGQPSANADADDLNPPVTVDDEDGVVFHTALISGVPNTITVTTSIGGYLQAWLDANGDGDWADANEQVITDRLLGPGPNQVNFLVPALKPGGTRTIMRFRLSGLKGLSYTGLAPDGEVEDYLVKLESLKWLQKPELGWQGVDVDNFWVQLADDFQCTQSGPITDFHLWGSFVGDVLPVGGVGNMTITLFLYSDVPAGVNRPYSHPGELLWQKTFKPGDYTAGHTFQQPEGEWWYDPASQFWKPNADQNIYQFDFYVDREAAFRQVEGTIYWLGMKYTASQEDGFTFGWKTTYEPWNDDACWFDTSAGMPVWRDMRYSAQHPYGTNSLNLAFAVSGEQAEALDFGDAPDGMAVPGYPTLLINNGARHAVVPGLKLGNAVDIEANGQPNATASGDDNNPLVGVDDEDGVIFPVLVPGQPNPVQVTVTGTGVLNAWLDFGADGSWAQTGDQIFTNVALATGVHTLNFNVPNTTPWGATTFARFRFSTTANLSYVGAAPDGEVEDHLVNIHPLPNSDMGDAPDSSNHSGANMTAYPSGGPAGVIANFPTVFGAPAPFGPHHVNARAVFLGPLSSGELEADMLADQDFINNLLPATDKPDLDAADDGLVPPVVLPHCGGGAMTLAFSWFAGAPPQMFLNIWCDWNRDGDWNDVMPCPDGSSAPEWACQNMPVPVGVPTLAVGIKSWHPSLEKQPLWVRITLAEQPWPGPQGFSGAGGDGPQIGYQFGETEDYYLTDYDYEQAFDFGDAPDTPYPTLLANKGARHLIVPNFHLGNQVDAEADGLPHALALGDDNNNLADEDGVKITAPVLVNTQACVDVFLTGALGGKLDGWLDLNKNGVWEAAEQFFNAQALVAGNNAGLCFAITNTAKLGTNFARFRLSSLGGLSPIGVAQEGEVEDYQVILRQRAPTTNIVITWIGVTNTTPTNQIVTVKWNAETNVHYEVLAAPNLGTNSGTDIVWQVISPEIIGPSDQHTHTNTSMSQRYYRVRAPWTYP